MNTLESLIKSSHRVIFMDTLEPERAKRVVSETIDNLCKDPKAPEIVKKEGLRLKSWDMVNGLESNPASTDYIEILNIISRTTDPTVYLLHNYHLILNDPRTNLKLVIEKLRELANLHTPFIYTILTGSFTVPTELSQYVGYLSLPLPNRKEIKDIINRRVKSLGITLRSNIIETLSDVMTGMTSREVENIFNICLIESKRKDKSDMVEIGLKYKASKTAKSGLVEHIPVKETIDDIGDMDEFVQWITRVSKAFKERSKAIEYKLPVPKGTLLAGVQGTGKTLASKITASVLGIPLLRVDIGKLYHSLLGKTEENTRMMFKEIEAQAPAVVLIDEGEKSLAGVKSSEYTSSGVTARLMSSLLYFMQENQLPLFFFFTVNDVTAIPPELMRRGRIDEVWFVDLPSKKGLEDIFRIHISKVGRDPKKYKVKKLAESCYGFTGAEVESVIKEAMYMAFYEDREFTTKDIEIAISRTIPLAVSRKEEIEALRKWGKSRARLVSSHKPTKRDVMNERWFE